MPTQSKDHRHASKNHRHASKDHRGQRTTDERRRLGAEGESRAAAYLEGRGYRIVARNVRSGGVELDLVATRGRCVVFVEVKTRTTERYGAPCEVVDPRQCRRIVRGAREWLRSHRVRAHRVRFDVIAWLAPARCVARERWHLTHVQDAFTDED